MVAVISLGMIIRYYFIIFIKKDQKLCLSTSFCLFLVMNARCNYSFIKTSVSSFIRTHLFESFQMGVKRLVSWEGTSASWWDTFGSSDPSAEAGKGGREEFRDGLGSRWWCLMPRLCHRYSLYYNMLQELHVGCLLFQFSLSMCSEQNAYIHAGQF